MGNSASSHKHANSCSNGGTCANPANVVDHCFMPASNSKLDPYSWEFASYRDFITAQDDETFFDSRPWLDSDSEDFLSVNDFTPSCNNSPILQMEQIDLTENDMHQECLRDTIKPIATFSEAPSVPKKRLIELFRESFRKDDRRETSAAKPFSFYLPLRYENHSLRKHDKVSVRRKTYETTPIGDPKTPQSAQCCFPNLVRSFSSNERKRKLSHASVVVEGN